MPATEPPVRLTPEEYELHVKSWLDAAGAGLLEYCSSHREVIVATDGRYEFDITCRFCALGADFLVLVECKNSKNKVKREQVQVLMAKLQSVGAQKAILCATRGFQAGALTFARQHGIALVRVADGRSSWLTRDASCMTRPWSQVPDYIPRIVGWLIGETLGHESLVSEQHGEYLKKTLTF